MVGGSTKRLTDAQTMKTLNSLQIFVTATRIFTKLFPSYQVNNYNSSLNKEGTLCYTLIISPGLVFLFLIQSLISLLSFPV